MPSEFFFFVVIIFVATYIIYSGNYKRATKAALLALKNTDVQKRLAAIRTVAELSATEALPMLIALLKDENFYIQWETITALGAMRHPTAAAALADVVHTGEPRLRSHAFMQLCKRQKITLPWLMGAAKHPDANIRKLALSAIKVCAPQKAVISLMGEALKDDSLEVRKVALSIFNQLPFARNKELIAMLVGYLGQEQCKELLRDGIQILAKSKETAAITALIKMLLEEQREAVHRDVIEALQYIGEPATLVLLDALKDNADKFVQRRILNALHARFTHEPMNAAHTLSVTVVHSLLAMATEENCNTLGSTLSHWAYRKETLPALKAAAKHSQPWVRKLALEALSQVESTKLDILLTSLTDNNASIRKNAAVRLGELNNYEVIPPLINTLDDADEGVQQSVIDALAKFGDHKAILALMNQLHATSNEKIRACIMTTILYRHAEREIPVAMLVDLLQDANADVRENAAQALGNMGSKSAISALTLAIEDPRNGEMRKHNMRLSLQKIWAASTAY